MSPAWAQLRGWSLWLTGLALVAGILRFLPHLTGTTWTQVGHVLSGLGPATVLMLVTVWGAGMYGHTWVQVAALPGLGHRRALMLNLASSAVASGLPGGGPLSIAANWAMLRSWGFSRAAFSTYTVLTTGSMAVGKLLLPLPAALAVVLAGAAMPAQVRSVVLVSGAAIAALVLLGVLACPLLRRWASVRSWLDAVRDRWHGLVGGTGAQLGLQYLLLVLCLHVTGAGAAPAGVLLAFAVGRLLSVVPLTPGGLGVTETGTAGLLVALGADPAAAISGVLLFSLFVTVLEIPLGAIGLLWWRRTMPAHR